MSLKEEVKGVARNRRRFLLLRIADVDTDTAMKLCGIRKGVYNNWLRKVHNTDNKFLELYGRRDELAHEFKQEAIQLLRRDNQLAAVLLEERILGRMKEEIESGEYSLLRTQLAREVYAKLIGDLDYQPQVQPVTWQQRVNQLFIQQPTPQEVIDGTITEGKSGFLTEHQESLTLQEGKQESS